MASCSKMGWVRQDMAGMRWDSIGRDLEVVTLRSLAGLFPGSTAVATDGFGPTNKAWVARFRISRPSSDETVIVKWFSELRADAYLREQSTLRAIRDLNVGPRLLGVEDDDLLIVEEDFGDETDPVTLGKSLAALHESTRSGEWPVLRLPATESIVDAIARNLAELDLSATPAIEEFENAVAVLEASPHSMIHGDVLPGNARRSPLGPRLIDFEDAAAGPSIIDAVAPLADFPTAARAIDWSVEDLNSFESTYRSLSQLWYAPWRSTDRYAADRAAGLGYWIGRALATNLTRAAEGALANHRPLYAASAISEAYPQIAQAAEAVRRTLFGSGPPA
jgi:hypothetical protein